VGIRDYGPSSTCLENYDGAELGLKVVELVVQLRRANGSRSEATAKG
jgi:hypothetical protein